MMENIKVIELLNFSELKDLQQAGKMKASFNSNIMFVQLWELAELYDYLNFDNALKTTVDSDLERAVDVASELSLRDILKKQQ